ncbi:hypothetical protein EJ04DRAFT_552467 [Polyplosphaeria fusca]|uniref:Uncharacterized protein n=1 Tax=Polyplosphaeria fusca TaxID=682080 RepID=A0A9P4QXR4_9PLEO|nr:hypothetical protein EJ04DRAFT_552467 [Polyplosphaeria fusca]
MQQLVQLRARSLRISQPTSQTQAQDASTEESTPTPDLSPTHPNLHILRSDIDLPPEAQNPTALAARIFCTYSSRPILIEWKYYSRRRTSPEFAYMCQRTAMLVLQLQQSADTDGFSILQCLGHFNDAEHHRIGMLFDTRSHASLPTLRDHILSDRPTPTSHCTKTPREKDEDGETEFELGTPYACGFDFSRQDMPYELTEELPAQVRYQAVVEIGLWQPVRHLMREREDAGAFSERLVGELLPELRYRMGKGYHGVAERCLRGSFGDGEGGSGADEGADEHRIESRRWLEALLQDAVRTLDKIQL